MSIKLGFVPTIVISSTKLTKEVMTIQDKIFCSRSQLLGQHKLSYNGLDLAFAPHGAYWREMRKLCDVYLFNSSAKSLPKFEKTRSQRMMENISKSASNTNLREETMSLSSSIICRVSLGKRYENEGIERNGLKRLLNETQAMFGTSFASDHFPFICGLIDDDHLDPKRPKPEQEDILDILIKIWKDGGSNIQFTCDQIKRVLIIIFVGGTDTGAAFLTWAMTFLMKNPRVMRNLCGNTYPKKILCGNKGFANEDDVQNLPHLKAVTFQPKA
ncbi:LOW QUALITY PROTEIN: p450 domain-containing protein [Cephalotus follicularis]|uniref:p450 domain-containing protein n=1 Tax=Cephalotus follicularis TaxID=3775 RepID=A0A1Q3CGE9_CEPFO|nr:LOW QUALITY PROTEIN: p450 domain-containing protein [Cephalotus follicularis]